eukprot:scaffold40171_cov20-Tisochrysis_lutea.AAC.2
MANFKSAILSGIMKAVTLKEQEILPNVEQTPFTIKSMLDASPASLAWLFAPRVVHLTALPTLDSCALIHT